jgi:hypothetical protein
MGGGFDVPKSRRGRGAEFFLLRAVDERILPDGRKTESFLFHDLAIHELADTRRSFRCLEKIFREGNAPTLASSAVGPGSEVRRLLSAGAATFYRVLAILIYKHISIRAGGTNKATLLTPNRWPLFAVQV